MRYNLERAIFFIEHSFLFHKQQIHRPVRIRAPGGSTVCGQNQSLLAPVRTTVGRWTLRVGRVLLPDDAVRRYRKRAGGLYVLQVSGRWSVRAFIFSSLSTQPTPSPVSVTSVLLQWRQIHYRLWLFFWWPSLHAMLVTDTVAVMNIYVMDAGHPLGKQSVRYRSVLHVFIAIYPPVCQSVYLRVCVYFKCLWL